MTGQIIETLKRQLKARGMTYAELARALGLSTPTVKRVLSQGSLTLERLEEILRVLEIDFLDLARLAHGRQGPVALTLEQETALARDPRLFSIFWLLCNEWRFDRIAREFGIGAPQLTLYFARLEKLRLIDWHPGNRARVRAPRRYVWRRGGPLRRAYGLKVVNEFMRSRFDSPLDAFHFEAQELSSESAAVVKRRFERLAAEVNELAEIDAASPARKRVSFGVMLALRPWNISIVAALRAASAGGA